LPYCNLYDQWNPRIYGRGNVLEVYFKNLKVETKDCFLSQCSWVASLFML
jgi:hypothetical protein